MKFAVKVALVTGAGSGIKKAAAQLLAKVDAKVAVLGRAIETDISDSTQQRDLEHVREPIEFPEGKIPLTDGKPGTSELQSHLECT